MWIKLNAFALTETLVTKVLLGTFGKCTTVVATRPHGGRASGGTMLRFLCGALTFYLLSESGRVPQVLRNLAVQLLAGIEVGFLEGYLSCEWQSRFAHES